ncbi:MAG: hypothetical protein ACXW2U_08245 [Telluria sp.]
MKTTPKFVLAGLVALTAMLSACRDQPKPPATAPASEAPAAQSREQAMSALMSLPELKAWATAIEKSSGGIARGALIEYDTKPRTVNGKSYYQFSFVENSSDAAQPWESFLVAQQGGEILVEDFGTGNTLTLDQWRKEKQPMLRTSAGITDE